MASIMQCNRRQRVEWLANAVVGLVLLAGCEIGVEQPVEQPTALAPAGSASVTAADADSTDGPVDPGSAAWHPAKPRAARAKQKVEQGKLTFVEGYRAGCQLATAQSKPLLLFFTAEWCRYCHQMAQDAFTHPQVVALSQSFVCVTIDADAEPAVCRQFGVTGYPTIQFVSPRGVPLERVVGKKPGHQLMMAMRAALQSVAHHDDDEQVAR